MWIFSRKFNLPFDFKQRFKKRQSVPNHPHIQSMSWNVHAATTANSDKLDKILSHTPLPVWRSKLILFIIFCLFVSLIIRGIWIASVNHKFYAYQSKKRIERTLVLQAFRGKFFDRNHLLLASSLPASSIWLEPEDLDFKQKNWQKASLLLNMPLDSIKKQAQKNKNYVFIKRQIDPVLTKKVYALHLKGLNVISEPKRHYTQAEVLSQLLGFTDVEHKGQEGLELFFNQQLKGVNGKKRVLKDRLGNTVDQTSEELGVITEPKNGADFTLTIDAHIQNEVHKALAQAMQTQKAKFATAVVLDAKTGEILAIANTPSFDPNETKNNQKLGMRNYALTDTFEVGSTIKPISIGIALDQGKITGQTTFDTSSVTVTKRVIRDAHPHPRLNTLQIIQKSSNVGTVKISNLVSAENMWTIYHKLGIGKIPTSVQFPGSASGRLRNYSTWLPIEKATMSYGYGISASILQLAQAYTIFANDGAFIPATLVKSDFAPLKQQIFSPSTVKKISQGLEMVTQEGGTAQKAQINGYRVGGKTGTVYKQVGKHYDNSKYRAFFVGLAPMSNPKIIVAVMLDEPSAGEYYGGAVAAPVFSRVAEVALRQLAVPLDKAIEHP